MDHLSAVTLPFCILHFASWMIKVLVLIAAYVLYFLFVEFKNWNKLHCIDMRHVMRLEKSWKVILQRQTAQPFFFFFFPFVRCLPRRSVRLRSRWWSFLQQLNIGIINRIMCFLYTSCIQKHAHIVFYILTWLHVTLLDLSVCPERERASRWVLGERLRLGGWQTLLSSPPSLITIRGGYSTMSI